MNINMKQWKQSVLQKKERIAIPIMTHSGIEIIGKKVVDAVSNGQVHYEAVKVLSEKYPSDACTIIMDLTVEAEAFGATVSFPEDEMPNVIGRLVSDRQSIEELTVPDLSSGRVPQYILANKLAAANIDKPVFSGCIGPFSLAGRLYDMSEIMMAMYIDPEATHLLLEKCNQFILSYCHALKEQGTQGVIIAEPAAGLLSNDACKEFSSEYVKKLVEELEDEHFLVVLHNCGNTGHCTEAMLYTGASGYHFGNKIDMEQVLAECPSDVLVMGNLDPVSIFKMSTEKEVFDATTELLQTAGSHQNFIISSGCDTPPHIPLGNIDAFYKALAHYNNPPTI